jgi:hypothetical protein
MNWGEPWYGGFRESQTEYRFKNQAYFKRNFMPGMLGWFKMTAETSVEDIEWLLARSAGYDAGYAFVANFESVEKNGNTGQILELIGDWEKLRIGNRFTEEQKALMRVTDNEFVLTKITDKEWNWSPVKAQVFQHEKKVRQPGEPLHSTFAFENIGAEQTLQFILTAIDADISAISLEINNYKEIKMPVALKKGQILKYIGGNQAKVYDANWQLVQTIVINPADFKVNPGENALSVDGQFGRVEETPQLKVEIRTFGAAEKVGLELQ